MFAKLTTLLGGAKGAAIAVAVAGAAATTGVVATNPDVQQAVQQTVAQVTGSDCSHDGQPAVVAARNDLDAKLRDAFQEDQTAIAKLHSTKVETADRAKFNDLLSEADAKLRARLTKALNDVAAATLGRVGQQTNATSTSSTTAATTAAGTSAASCDRGANVTFTASERDSLDTTVVKPAIEEMSGLVTDVTDAVAKLSTATGGKPADAGSARPTGSPSR
jgi:hypothetical protein